MRSIWLASTALLMTAGIACAQSTTAPAATGAVKAPAVSPGTASPGNMGSSASPSGSMPMSSATPPAPTGAVSAPNVTPPKAAPGKMAPSSSSSQNMAAPASASTSAMKTTHTMHHHWMHSASMGMPADGTPAAYLTLASSAIKHHNPAMADDALSHAETRLLDRSVPQGAIAADSTPAIQSIESARQALHAGNYSKASADTSMAASAASD